MQSNKLLDSKIILLWEALASYKRIKEMGSVRILSPFILFKDFKVLESLNNLAKLAK